LMPQNVSNWMSVKNQERNEFKTLFRPTYVTDSCMLRNAV
jgi:hypothetical protein